MQNPIEGLLPDFAILGGEFTELWQKLFAGFWGLAMIAAIVFLVFGIAKLSQAGNTGNPDATRQARGGVIWAAISLGGLVALGVIVGGIIGVFA